jgi:hypothetical protein
MEKRQIFLITYSINYPSGKKYIVKNSEFIAFTEYGAKELLKWQKSNSDITILKVEPTYKYIGNAEMPDYRTLGDF